ncbi:MAG: N-Acetyl-D-glucosamine transport system, permease protein 2 [Verrucomicrobia bacterium]|nr:N-Acetyl-D-glucosamine transport system, permease protein 2 [Verrucomicrobiota bacterium]
MKAVRVTIWLLVVLGAVSMLIPFLWMVSTSLKTDSEAFAWPPKLVPWPPQWSNYGDALRVAPFGRFFLNSLFISLSVTTISLFLNSLAAYGFAKFRFKGSQVTMIPAFLLLKQLGWLDTYTGLIVPGIAGAFGVFFLRQYMITLPDELFDAARMDGASEMAVYWRIVLPLAKPALATLAIFTFMGSWNDFLGPLIVVKSEEMKTLPLAISALSAGHYVMSWPLLMAGACFVILPVLIVYVLAQRYFVEGIAMGGVKG